MAQNVSSNPLTSCCPPSVLRPPMVTYYCLSIKASVFEWIKIPQDMTFHGPLAFCKAPPSREERWLHSSLYFFFFSPLVPMK